MIRILVREVGRGRDVLERSLEIAWLLWGMGGDDRDSRLVCTYFGKCIFKIHPVHLSDFQLAI